LPEIPPALPFSKGGELFGIRWKIPSTFSPFGKGGMKGDFTAFQIAKLLQKFLIYIIIAKAGALL
jgi:hypothetical protein